MDQQLSSSPKVKSEISSGYIVVYQCNRRRTFPKLAVAAEQLDIDTLKYLVLGSVVKYRPKQVSFCFSIWLPTISRYKVGIWLIA